MILLLLRCGLLPEQAEAQRREQGDSVGDQLRRAADAHEQVIDGVVDDGDAEQAEQARRAEQAAAPHGAQDAAVHAAADDVHRARTEAADEQINELPRAVLRQVADVLKGGEAREPREVGDVEDLRRFLPQQQMQRPVERAEREGRIKAGQQEPRPAARPVVFPQHGAEAAGRHKELYEVIQKLKHRRAPPRCPRPAPAHAGGRTAPSRTRRARRPAVPLKDSRGSHR